MNYAAALVDLDGTVWRGRELVPGADRALTTLRERGVPVVFVTTRASDRSTSPPDSTRSASTPKPDRS